MANTYVELIMQLEQIHRSVTGHKTDQMLAQAWTQLDAIYDQIANNHGLDLYYINNFKAQLEQARQHYNGLKTLYDKRACLVALTKKLTQMTYTSGGISSSSPHDMFGQSTKIINYRSSSSQVSQPRSCLTQPACYSSQDLMTLELLRINPDQDETTALKKSLAKIRELTSQVEQLNHTLRHTDKERSCADQQYRDTCKALNAARNENEMLRKSSLPTDFKGVLEHVHSIHPRLPNDLQEVVDEMLTLQQEIVTKATPQWFEANLDRIRASVYSSLEPLSIFIARRSAAHQPVDYYCISLLQYGLHRLLFDRGLKVICPSRGDLFRKNFHDFTERDLVWVDDESRDNQVDAVRRVGFIYDNGNGQPVVLKKALVRRCVFNTDSVQESICAEPDNRVRSTPELDLIEENPPKSTDEDVLDGVFNHKGNRS